MRSAVWIATLAAVAGVAGCGGSGNGSRATATNVVVQRPPLAPCSLLTVGEVSGVLGVRVHLGQTALSCTYQARTRSNAFRAVVVTPQRVAAAPPGVFGPRDGPIRPIVGPGYHGQAQNAPPSETEAGLEQAHAQVISGDVIVRLQVTYKALSLRGAPQLPEAAALANRVGRRLAGRR
jgi:hypothetical protein